MSDGAFLDRTGYHKLYIESEKGEFVVRRAMDLNPGDVNQQIDYFPVVYTNASTTDFRFDAKNLRNDVVPFEFRIILRLLWLSRQLDEESAYMQITSGFKEWRSQIQLLANILGTAPFNGSSLLRSMQASTFNILEIHLKYTKNLPDGEPTGFAKRQTPYMRFTALTGTGIQKCILQMLSTPRTNIRWENYMQRQLLVRT